MKATIWHNPKCGTSQKTLAILQETPGIELTIIEYLKAPYERKKLAQLIKDAGMTPKEAIRKMGTDAEEKGLPVMDDDTILDEMADNPAYVNRPFVETEKGVRFCRPQDKVREIL
jgi:arsenate reductase